MNRNVIRLVTTVMSDYSALNHLSRLINRKRNILVKQKRSTTEQLEPPGCYIIFNPAGNMDLNNDRTGVPSATSLR